MVMANMVHGGLEPVTGEGGVNPFVPVSCLCAFFFMDGVGVCTVHCAHAFGVLSCPVLRTVSEDGDESSGVGKK